MLGQSSSILAFTEVRIADASSCSVIVSNLAGRVISSPASLTLIPLPRLIAIRSGLDIVLTSPSGAARFSLQSGTNLIFPTVWVTVSPGPVS